MSVPLLSHSTTSVAPKRSRQFSSVSPMERSGTLANSLAATRACCLRSLLSTLRVVRPKFKPAAKADSTRTSNQLSMERETNWYDTV